MKTVGRKEIRDIDKWAIEKLGISEIILMENAGRSVVQNILADCGKIKNVCVFCGKGANGGDGFVISRTLFVKGINVQIVLLCKKSEVKGSSKINLDLAEKLGIKITEVSGKTDLPDYINKCDILVDAIFGVGFSGKIKKPVDDIIEAINALRKKGSAIVVSVDVPSGLDCDTGAIGGTCIGADITVTFTYSKKGLMLSPGSGYVGKLVVSDIGIPIKGKTENQIRTESIPNALTLDLIAGIIPRREQSAHKGDCGKVFVLAGSAGMTGAAIMTCKAALRVGAGIVQLGIPESLALHVDPQLPEMITVGLPETKNKSLSLKAISKIIDLCAKSDVIAIGPGISQDPDTKKLISELLPALAKLRGSKKIILDADGLNAISDNTDVLNSLKTDIIVTPHPGEMSRISNKTVTDIQQDRINIAKEFSVKYGIFVALKGNQTVLAKPDGKYFINLTGNPGMASAGMGDVLTGAIAGFAAQNMNLFDAAMAGIYVHGMSGDVVASIKGQHGLIASDVIDAMPFVIKSTRR